jgi:uracil-DNA glycosylase family 4
MTNRVIVGEAPGETEVAQGKPFVGKAGKRMNDALKAACVDRLAVHVTNAVLCRPEGNATPPKEVIDACRERLIKEIRSKMPTRVLALGTTAKLALTGDKRPIKTLRLLPHVPSSHLGGPAKVRVTYHPSALTRNPDWPGHFDSDVGWLS